MATNGKTTAVANVPKSLIGMNSYQIQKFLGGYKQSIESVIQGKMTADRFIYMVSFILNTPKIKECTTSSIIGSIMSTAILNLNPVPQLGQVWFVPYADRKAGTVDLQFQIGYQGWITILTRTGIVKNIRANCVREHDQFENDMGIDQKLIHRQELINPGKLIGVYAIATMENGFKAVRILNRDEVMARKKRSKTPSTIWETDLEPEMWLKTAIKVARKQLPLDDSIDYRPLLLDEKVIRPDMISSEDGDIDVDKLNNDSANEIEEAEEIAMPESGNSEGVPLPEEPNDKKTSDPTLFDQTTETPKESPADEFSKKVYQYKQKILAKPELRDSFWGIFGTKGYEDPTQVQEKDRASILKELEALSNKVKK